MTSTELGPVIAAWLRDHADRLETEARSAAVDTTDAGALEQHARRLREPDSIRQLADDTAEQTDDDLITDLRRGKSERTRFRTVTVRP
jgi:hypothetical protein